MGYMMLMAECFACGKCFTCNPVKVPSYQGQPICEGCIVVVNERRKVAGLPLWPVLPGAYEPGMEEE